MDRMRILMTADAIGGVWQYATDLAEALAADGHEIVLALMGPGAGGDQKDRVGGIAGVELVETGLPLDWLAEEPGALARAHAALSRLAAERRADCLQLNAPALAAFGRFPVPTVCVAHSCLATWWEAVGEGPLPDDFRWRCDLTGRGLRSADAVAAPSAAFAEALRRTYRLSVAPHVALNGRTRLPLREAAQHDCVFTAGRLWDRGKDLATLDRAAAGLGFPVYAAGPTEAPNGERIGFEHLHSLGRLDETEIADRLAAKPVFVSTARYEPFGLAVLEAAAAGCALVLSDIPTFRELWNGAAVFVAPGDDEGLAAALSEIVGDDARRAEIGAAAAERAQGRTPAAMARRMAGIYAAAREAAEASPERAAA